MQFNTPGVCSKSFAARRLADTGCPLAADMSIGCYADSLRLGEAECPADTPNTCYCDDYEDYGGGGWEVVNWQCANERICDVALRRGDAIPFIERLAVPKLKVRGRSFKTTACIYNQRRFAASLGDHVIYLRPLIHRILDHSFTDSFT